MFGDPKQQAKQIIDKQYAATQLNEGGDVDEDLHGMHAVAEDILKAIKGGDAEELAIALHSFHEVCTKMPQED